MTSFDFKSPQSLGEACNLLAAPGSRAIAGGTDVIPQLRDGRFQADTLVDLSHIPGLDTIAHVGDEIVIGSLTTYTTMMNSDLVRHSAPFLAQVSGVVGGVQTQNRGTLGGNIANASPAGDTLPVLLALNAWIDLVSDGGERSMSLASFLLGPGRTAITPGELIRRIRFAPLPPDSRSLFLRLGNRRGMLISIVSAALVVAVGADGRVRDCRIALGAVAPTPIRCPEAESLLLGRQANDQVIELVASAAAAACRPIDDVRASAEYRRHGVKVLVRRGLKQLALPEGMTR